MSTWLACSGSLLLPVGDPSSKQVTLPASLQLDVLSLVVGADVDRRFLLLQWIPSVSTTMGGTKVASGTCTQDKQYLYWALTHNPLLSALTRGLKVC